MLALTVIPPQCYTWLKIQDLYLATVTKILCHLSITCQCVHAVLKNSLRKLLLFYILYSGKIFTFFTDSLQSTKIFFFEVCALALLLMHRKS